MDDMEYKDRVKAKMKGLNLQDALEYTAHLLDAIREPLIILDEKLKVALVSRSFCQAFQVKSEETDGRFIYDLGNRQWNIPKLRQLLEEILPKTTSFDGFEVEHEFPKIGKRIMLLNARRIYLEGNRAKLILLAIEDVTERRKIEHLESKIKDLETQLKRMQK